MHPKWRQQGLGRPLRTMFLFQDADAKQQESWSCIWLELVRLYKLLFSLPPPCPGDCLIVLLKLSPLIPVSLLWCSAWEIQGLVQPVLMRVLYRALANKMCGEQRGSIRDAWMICLTCLFHLFTCCTPHSLERCAVTCWCLGLSDLYLTEPWFQGW